VPWSSASRGGGGGQGRSLSRSQQEADLKDLRAAFPEYGALQSHVLQDVLARLDTTYQAFFRRVQSAEQPGFPRFQGRGRYHSFTDTEYGNGAHLENGFLVLAKIGRLAVRWSRPVVGTTKTVTQDRHPFPQGGWLVGRLLLCRGTPTTWLFTCRRTAEERLIGTVQARENTLQHLAVDVSLLWPNFFDGGRLGALAGQGDTLTTLLPGNLALFQAGIVEFTATAQDNSAARSCWGVGLSLYL